MYFKGIGVEKDEKRGTEFIIQAASKGHQEAQYELGLMRILLCSNATYRSRSMKDFIHNEANLSDGSIQHSELLSPPPPPPPPPGSPEEVKTLISATVKESRAIVASNWREEENNIAEVLKIAHVAVEKHDEEESDSIEDWLNTIEDGYGNMYHMVFLSSGYETLQKLERDCGKAEVVQFLLQKLKNAGARRPQIRRISDALEAIVERSSQKLLSMPIPSMTTEPKYVKEASRASFQHLYSRKS